MSKPVIELVNIVKNYGERIVLNGLSLTINNGEFVTILGPSGSGKTTILRLIGGFEWPTRGEIKFDGLDVKDLSAHKRFTCTIFQNYALFPHLNVEKNIQYGLRLKRIKLDDVKPEVYKKLESEKKNWYKKAELQMRKLDKEQAKYAKIMTKNKRSTPTYKRARKWLDNSDFNYSYWENYVNLKQETFDKKYTTRRISKKEMIEYTDSVIKRVRLEGFEKHKIDQLSGGMQQRVALARAIVIEPKVLLLDEPLSALDLKVRQQTQAELKSLHRRLGITFVLITHNQEEALELSDRVAIIRDGKIVQYDTPKKIYMEPVNAWVANFVGNSNIFPGKIVKSNVVEVHGFEIKTTVKKDYEIGEEVDVLIRPEQLKLVAKSQKKINGQVLESTYKGSYYELRVQSLVSSKIFLINAIDDVKIGQEINLSWDVRDVHIMKKEIKNEAQI